MGSAARQESGRRGGQGLVIRGAHDKLLDAADATIKIGDRLEMIPSHGCTTSHLYPEFIVYENGLVTDNAGPSKAAGKTPVRSRQEITFTICRPCGDYLWRSR